MEASKLLKEEELTTSSAKPDGSEMEPAAMPGDQVAANLSGAVKEVIPLPVDTEDNSNDKDEEAESLFECNICLDIARDAVVSMCGHLFCWPCLHQWLLTRPLRQICPVCKAAVSRDSVVPLYGRNSVQRTDPRIKAPPRPMGRRIEPEPEPWIGFTGFGFADGFHLSFGIGSFPFGFAWINSTFNLADVRPDGHNEEDEDEALSKLFLYLAFLFIGWLFFA